jgi:hypothetical protein
MRPARRTDGTVGGVDPHVAAYDSDVESIETSRRRPEDVVTERVKLRPMRSVFEPARRGTVLDGFSHLGTLREQPDESFGSCDDVSRDALDECDSGLIHFFRRSHPYPTVTRANIFPVQE